MIEFKNKADRQIRENSLVYAKDVQGKDGFYITYVLPTTQAATIDNYGTCFTALHPCELQEAVLWYDVATGTTPATLQLKKQEELEGFNDGDNILITAWDLSATARTNYIKRKEDFNTSSDTRTFNRGDRIGMVVAAANLTSMYHAVITFYFKYLNNGDYRN